MLSKSIHIEGLDLAGKSTAVRLLAERLAPAAIRRNSLLADNKLHRQADELRRTGQASEVEVGQAFLEALYRDLEEYTVPTGQNLIQDSTILLRSLAHHLILPSPKIVASLLELMPRHPRYDISIILTASPEVRRERLAQRVATSPEELAPEDYFVVQEPERFRAMESVLIGLATRFFDARLVDTSMLAPEEIVDIILGYVSHET